MTPPQEGRPFASGEIEQFRSAIGDRYRIESEIGRGGMAIVFRAEDLKHNRTVAVKVLTPELSATIGAERFEREIRIAARLQHPHILPVHDSGSAGGLLYYTMPFVVGESLRARLSRERQLPIEDAVAIAREVADALQYAHAEGVIHRDIKPDNILFASGHAVIADFGIARAAEAGDRVTKTGIAVGTVTYMSPEQFTGDIVDPRVDIYALGCVLYEMLVGDPPFTGSTPTIIMARHSMQQVPSIRMVRPSVPLPIEAAVARALAKVPADRFPSMAEFKAALEGDHSFTATWIKTATQDTPYPAAKRLSLRHFARRWATGGAIAGLVLGVIGAAITAFALSRRADAVAPNAHKIAVLYFENRSESEQLRSFSDGLTESLIEQLAVVPGLDVVTRSGVDPFRERSLVADSVAVIAEQLRVGSVVRGRVEPSGNGVRVEVALLDGTGRQWDQRSFEHPSANLLAVRDTVAEQVAEFLRQRLGKEFTLRASRSRTGSPDAWLLGQRAERRRKDAERLLAGDSTAAGLIALREADSLLAAAGELDDQWPDALAGRADLARLRATALRGNRDSVRAIVDSGLRLAESALQRDARHADALEARGSLRYLLLTTRTATERETPALLDAAERDLLESVRWNPSQATAWVTLSSLYYRKLDVAEAKNAALRAYDADAWLRAPDLILPRLFWTNHDLEIFAEAKRWCDEGRARFPDRPFFYECQLWLQLAPKGIVADPDRAWALRDSLIERTPARLRGFADRQGQILAAGSLARANLPDSARRVLLRARAGARDVDPQGILAGMEGIVRVILGDRAEAVEQVKAYLTASPDHRPGFAKSTGWWWRDLQNDPAFIRVVHATGR